MVSDVKYIKTKVSKILMTPLLFVISVNQYIYSESGHCLDTVCLVSRQKFASPKGCS